MKLSPILHSALAVLAAAFTGASHAQQQYQWSNFVGKPGGAGNVDGPVAKAKFNSPTDIVRDASGNLFVAAPAAPPSARSRPRAWSPL